MLITPLGDGMYSHRLLLCLPESVLYPVLGEPDKRHVFWGTLGPPKESGNTLQFELKEVSVVSRDHQPIHLTLTGTIVAKKAAPEEFENELKDWNTYSRIQEAWGNNKEEQSHVHREIQAFDLLRGNDKEEPDDDYP